MPAIHPARLKQQAMLLAQHYDEPPVLVRSLHHLLDFYADRAQRPGQSGIPRPLLAAYRVKPPVLRQVERELAPLVQADPEAGWALVQMLWEQPYLEFRTLAASLLGELPPDPPGRIFEAVRSWVRKDTEQALVDALSHSGLMRLRQEHPDVMIKALSDLLGDKDLNNQRLGLRILLPLVDDPPYPNLPALFRLIQPFVRVAPNKLRPDILDVLASMARRSPVETASFLRQILTMPENPDTAWLIRQSISAFPQEIQERLRSAVRSPAV